MVRAVACAGRRSSLVRPNQAQPSPSLCRAPLGHFCRRLFRGARCSGPFLHLLRAGRRQSNLPHELPHRTLTPRAPRERFSRTCAGIPLRRINLPAVSALILHKIDGKLAHLLSPLAASSPHSPFLSSPPTNGVGGRGPAHTSLTSKYASILQEDPQKTSLFPR